MSGNPLGFWKLQGLPIKKSLLKAVLQFIRFGIYILFFGSKLLHIKCN
jgi:hypothetical protein